jgi:hypothetical protein
VARELDHIELANRNHEALAYLLKESTRFPEWIATMAFYKAVQLVEAAFSRTGEGTTSSHGERFQRLKRNTRFAHVFPHYRTLWQSSTIARYLVDQSSGAAYRSFSDYMSPAQVVEQLVRHRLRQIEKSIAEKDDLLTEDARKRIQLIER